MARGAGQVSVPGGWMGANVKWVKALAAPSVGNRGLEGGLWTVPLQWYWSRWL